MIVDLWHVDARPSLSRADEIALRAGLAPEERARAARLVYEPDARRFVIFHAALRIVLAESCAVPVSGIAYAYGANGKPRLAGRCAETGVRFSLSHCGSEACIAVCSEAEVGIDIEVIDPELDVIAVAQQFLSNRERALLEEAGPQARQRRFFELWTRREAMLKALGLGLSDAVEIPANDEGGNVVEVCSIEPREGLTGALAVIGGPFSVRQREVVRLDAARFVKVQGAARRL